MYINIYIERERDWDHTNPPHPHHHPFNKFKLECIRCNNSLNARKTELSSLQFKSFQFIKSDVWGWGGFVWPLREIVALTSEARRRSRGPAAHGQDALLPGLYIQNTYVYIYICIYIYIYIFITCYLFHYLILRGALRAHLGERGKCSCLSSMM